MIAVVEHDLEHPVGIRDLRIDLRLVHKTRAAAGAVEERRAVAVVDTLQVAVGRAPRVVPGAAVAFVRTAEIDADAVFRLVAVEHGIALVVSHLADQPAEDAFCIQGIGDPRVRVEPVDDEDVVLGCRAPVDVARCSEPGPALDAREQTLDARPVATDAVAVEVVLVDDQATGWITHPERVRVPPEAWSAGDPGAVGVLPVHGYKVFCAGEDEDVRILGVQILGKTFVGLAADRRKGKSPAKAERAISGTGVVTQRELGPETRAPGTRGDGHRHGAGTRDRIRGELLTAPANRAPSLREGDRRRLGRWSSALRGSPPLSAHGVGRPRRLLPTEDLRHRATSDTGDERPGDAGGRGSM